MKLTKIRQSLDKKEISVKELVSYYEKNIKEKNSVLNCYITVCNDTLSTEIENAQYAINSNSQKSLCGIPFSIKDNICTNGIKTTCASKMLKDFTPVYDATVIKKIKSENAIILGKTNMDEFAMGSTTKTSYYGGVRNPYNTEFYAGGSSGGSACSVSAKMCAASIASDTGGSVRQPAAFCGVSGLKPTHGTISRHGLIAFASSLDQIGIIGKYASDTGFILNSLYGIDSYDMTTSKNAPGNYLEKTEKSIKGIKIGIPKEFFNNVCDEVKNSVLIAAKHLESLGAVLVPCSISASEFSASAYYIISSAQAASNLSRYDGIKYGYRSKDPADYKDLISTSRQEGFGFEVKKRIMLGNYALSSGYYDEYYKKAVQVKNKLHSEFNNIFNTCDVILTPTTSDSGYKINSDDDFLKTYNADMLTACVNLSGLPAISIPCGYNKNNVPVGMSIIGRAFDEATIIQLADVYEKDFEFKEAII